MTSPSLTKGMKQPSKYNHSYQVSVSSCFTKNTYSPPNASVLESFTNIQNLNSSQNGSACVYVKCELCQKLFSKNSIKVHRRHCQKHIDYNIYSSNSFYNSNFSSQSYESSSSIQSTQMSQFTPSLTRQRESPIRELWGDHYNTYYCLLLSPSSRNNRTLEETRLQCYNCPKCSLTFQKYDELQDHILAHNFEEWEETQLETSPMIVRSSSSFLVRRNPIAQRSNQMIELRRPSVYTIENNDPCNESPLNFSQRLPTFRYCKTKLLEKSNLDKKKNEKYEAEICVICLDDYKEEERLKRLPCLHLFHAHCVNRWFEKSNVCPCCKACIDEVKLSS